MLVAAPAREYGRGSELVRSPLSSPTRGWHLLDSPGACFLPGVRHKPAGSTCLTSQICNPKVFTPQSRKEQGIGNVHFTFQSFANPRPHFFAPSNHSFYVASQGLGRLLNENNPDFYKLCFQDSVSRSEMLSEKGHS